MLNPDAKVIVTTIRIAATFKGEEDQVDRIEYWLRMPKAIKLADYMPTTQIGAEDAEVIHGNQLVSNEATVTSLNGGAGVGFRFWNFGVGAERRDEKGHQIASNVTVKSLPRKALVLAASTEDIGRTLHFKLKRHSQFTLQGDRDYVVLAKVPKDWSGDDVILECAAYRDGITVSRNIVSVGLYIEGDGVAKRRAEDAAKRRDAALSDVLTGNKWMLKIPLTENLDGIVFIFNKDNTVDMYADVMVNNKIVSVRLSKIGDWYVKDGVFTLSVSRVAVTEWQFVFNVINFNDSEIICVC